MRLNRQWDSRSPAHNCAVGCLRPLPSNGRPKAGPSGGSVVTSVRPLFYLPGRPPSRRLLLLLCCASRYRYRVESYWYLPIAMAATIGVKGKVLHSQAREIVDRIAKFMKTEAEAGVRIPLKHYR